MLTHFYLNNVTINAHNYETVVSVRLFDGVYSSFLLYFSFLMVASVRERKMNKNGVTIGL